MRKIIAALLVYLGLASAALAQTFGPPDIGCNAAAIVPAGTTGPLTIIPAVAGKRIYICGWNFTSATGSSTFQLLTAGGVNCATAGTALTPALNVDTSGPNIDHTQYAQLQTATGEKLCVAETGTPANVTGIIWYSQF